MEISSCYKACESVTQRLAGDALFILVVEDHADTRRMLRIFLERSGHHVQVAATLGEALYLCEETERRFDLLLCDIGLPDGNGWNLLQILKTGKSAPSLAIALSGWDSDDDIAKSRAAGFFAHLIKPVPPDKFTRALRAAADRIKASGRN